MVHNTDYKKRKAMTLNIDANRNNEYHKMVNSSSNKKAKEIFRRPAFSIGKTEKED